MMRTSNPALNANAFAGAQSFAGGEAMTIQGTVNKTFFLLFLAVLTGSWVWGKAFAPAVGYDGLGPAYGTTPAPAAAVGGLIMIGVFGGFIAALITVFKKQWAPITAPVYALLEGLVLGGISAYFEMSYPGIVVQAVALTFGTLFCLLMAYKSGLIKVTDNFRLGIVAATGAICLIYLVSWIMSFFGSGLSFIHAATPFGIVFSLIVVGIAALNLVLDFDFIEKGAHMGAPKYMEWYGAFGLMVTLIWLYLEMLRLLAKMNSRR